MFVDDEPANLRLLERLFRRQYQCLTAASGAEALRLLEQHDVALLITDQRMPNMTGIELLKNASGMRPHMVRMILTGYTDVGALVEAINCGQVYKYVTKPWNNEELQLTVTRALEHYETNRARHELTLANQRLNARLKEMSQGFVRAIADALEAKDEYVYGHARRVKGYAVAIGKRMGMDEAALEELSLAAFLHDIGKIGTPDHILAKPAVLTDEERAIMQLYVERGARILASVPEMDEVANIVRYHQEHFDGAGYPEGLRGEQIPLSSRIISVANAYDAMTSPRPFRHALTHEETFQRLEERAEKHFDPAVVRAFKEFEALSQIRQSIAEGFSGERISPVTTTHEFENIAFDDLIREVESEPVLAASVLRYANAGGIASTVTSLKVAASEIGETIVSRLIARHCTYASGYDAEKSWEHAVRCAVASKLLAEQTGILAPDDAYTLGLLHDIGKLLLHALFPEEMESFKHLDDDARVNMEVAAFGVDHAQVSQWVLESCGMPRSLTAIVQTHHDLMRINDPAAVLLHIADDIANADQAYKAAALDKLGSDRLAILKLDRSQLATIHAQTAAAIEQQVNFEVKV
jgi:putative nucleotidyltransferase with HDIG domain